MNINQYQIGQVSTLSSVSIDTIRYYEKIGLIEKPIRSNGGFRKYSPQIVDKLNFIQQAQRLGFSLKEISHLLSLRVNRDSSCRKVKKQTEGKIADIERKILDLQKMKKALKLLAAECKGSGPTDDCPILRNLDIKNKKGVQ